MTISIKLYFKLASTLSIVDRPNERSSHTGVIIRGAGIIFVLAVILSYFIHNSLDVYFISGALLISIFSFVDDIRSLPPSVRLSVHVISISLLYISLSFQDEYLFHYFFFLFFALSVVNAFNFMDGINGITGLYSLTTMASLFYLSWHLLDKSIQFLYFSITYSVLIFLYFNFRKRAMCFAGDVGSISIAFLILYLSGLTFTSIQSYLLLWFFGVYGIDTCLTFFLRLVRRENVFVAHRSHAYQLLANQGKIDHRLVSLYYSVVQLIINISIIFIFIPYKFSFLFVSMLLALPLIVIYILIYDMYSFRSHQ